MATAAGGRPLGTRARCTNGPGAGKGPGCRCEACRTANRDDQRRIARLPRRTGARPMGLDDDEIDAPGYMPQTSWRRALGTGTGLHDDPLGLARRWAG